MRALEDITYDLDDVADRLMNYFGGGTVLKAARDEIRRLRVLTAELRGLGTCERCGVILAPPEVSLDYGDEVLATECDACLGIHN